MLPSDPDPDGVQLKAIQEFLKTPAGQQIEQIWLDAQCMPQDIPRGTRSEEDTADFKTMLSMVNLLYLGCSVLILLDLSYASRFWTQFEAWLSMQTTTPEGLTPAVGGGKERYHIVCVQNAAEQAETHKQLLVKSWATKTPDEAHTFLARPDVTVTSMSDKEIQLPKIGKLDDNIRQVYSDYSNALSGILAVTPQNYVLPQKVSSF
jgi:hypothetical protein